MPWCPVCGREYKSGFTLCPFCKRDLINDRLMKPAAGSSNTLNSLPPAYVYEGDNRFTIGSEEYPNDKGFYLINSEITDYRYIKGVLHRLKEAKIPFTIVEGSVIVQKDCLDRANELTKGEPMAIITCGENDDDIYMGGLDEIIKPVRLAIAKDGKSLEQIKKALRLANITCKVLGTGIFVRSDALKAAMETIRPYMPLLVSAFENASIEMPAARQEDRESRKERKKDERPMGEEVKKKRGLFGQRDEQDW